jgi:uncharacterized membrane protein YczE
VCEARALVEIQFLAIGNVLDPVMHLGVNPFAILTGSLVHASGFLPVALQIFRVITKILSGRSGKVAAMLNPGAPFNLLDN